MKTRTNKIVFIAFGFYVFAVMAFGALRHDWAQRGGYEPLGDYVSSLVKSWRAK